MTSDELRDLVEPHRQAVEAICARGGVAVVVGRPEGATKVLLESWGWTEGQTVLRLPARARKHRLPGFTPTMQSWLRKAPPEGTLRVLVFEGERYWPYQEVTAAAQGLVENEAAALTSGRTFRVRSDLGFAYFATVSEATAAANGGRVEGRVGDRWLRVEEAPEPEQVVARYLSVRGGG